MPKGKTANRKLRKEVQELREFKARHEDLREPLVKPVLYDWVCKCQFYCYWDRDRCPSCNCSRGQGQPRPGYKRRLLVERQTGPRTSGLGVARVPGPQYSPTRRVQQQYVQPPLVQQQAAAQRNYLEAARAQPAGQIQTQGPQQTLQQRSTLPPPRLQAQAPQQQILPAGPRPPMAT